MIKIKIYVANSNYKSFGNTSIPVYDCRYCVYIFGYLLHSILLPEMTSEEIQSMFKGKKIIAA